MNSTIATCSRSERPRTVAFVHDSNVFGGMELHMLLLLRYLDRQRYTPIVFVPGFTELPYATPHEFIKEVEKLGLPILRPPHPGSTPIVSIMRDVAHISLLFRKAGVDVVHIHTNHPRGARKATLAARLAGVHTVIRSEHLPPTHFGLSPVIRFTTPLFDALTNYLVVGSQACWEEQVRVMHRRNVHLSIYGIELDRFDANHDVTTAKQRLGLDPSVPVVGAIGRLAELKGHSYYIAAAERVVRDYAGPVNFLLVGDGPLRKKLESQVAGLGLSDRFHFAGFQADTVPYMAATDIAVMPTAINEGISLAMLEYMAMGKPMIATDEPSFKETVIPGRSGLIVPKKNSGTLAEAILHLLYNPDLASSFRREGLALVRQRFDIRRQAEEMMDLYDSLQEKALHSQPRLA